MMAQKELDEEEIAFYESIEIVYVALLRFFGRLASLAAKTPGSQDMATALSNIQNGPPTTFYEALLIDYLYFIVSEHMDAVNVRSCGHFDRLFYPFYKHDMDSGINEETLKKQLAYFFMQFVAIGCYYGQPVYIGGTD